MLPDHRAQRRRHRGDRRGVPGGGAARCRPAGSSRPPACRSRRAAEAGVAAAPGEHIAPSTEPQREVWLAARLGPEASLAYNESVSLHLRGELDVARAAPGGAPAAGPPRRAARDVLRRRPDRARRGSRRRARARRPAARARRARAGRARRGARRDHPAPRHRAVRSRARPAGPRRAGPARGRSPRAGVHRPPHRARRLVVLGAGQGHSPRCTRSRPARATAALAPAPSFIDYAAACAARADSPEVTAQRALVDRPVRRRRAVARPADRPAAAGDADHARRARGPRAARRAGRPGQEARRRPRRQPVRDPARRVLRAAPPADRPDRRRRRHPGGGPGRGRPRGPDRPLRATCCRCAAGRPAASGSPTASPRRAASCSTPTSTRTSRSAACSRSCRSPAIPAGCR